MIRRKQAKKARQVITAADLPLLAETNGGVIQLGPGDIVTAEAYDRAGWLGLVFEQGPREPKEAPRLAGVAQHLEPPAAAGSVLISGGQLLLPGHGLCKTDILLNEGRVAALGQSLGPASSEFDASGLVVVPGLIDPHVHLGLFAPLSQELQSEGQAALLGGITSLGLFLGGPGSHHDRLRELAAASATHSRVDVLPHLVIGERSQLDELDDYIANGVRSFKAYMAGIPGLIEPVDDAFLSDLFRALSAYAPDVVLCIHAENASLVAQAESRLGEGARDLESWAPTHPPLAEAEAIARAALLGEEWGVPTYFVHISSAAGVEALRRARTHSRQRLWGETTSPYLGPPPEAMGGAAGKMIPPLRSAGERDALWTALGEGTLNSVGTDNVTMTGAEKNLNRPFPEVMPGYPMLGTHLPLLLEAGYHQRGLPLETIISAVTRQVAEIFGLYPQKGSLLPGSDADCVVLDLHESRVVRADQLRSRSDFAPHAGQSLRGWPVLTIKGGQVVALFGQLQEGSSTGRLLLRNG